MIQMYNDKALITGVAFKKLILDQLPQNILEQMPTADRTGMTDQEIISIITNARRTAKKWDAAMTILGRIISCRSHEQSEKKYPYEEKWQSLKRN